MSDNQREWKILFVCLGNICRSPIAEAVFKSLAEEAGLNVTVDSAGIIDYHEGNPPDSRARRTLQKHNVPVNHRARQVVKEDFTKFDYIFGKDQNNIQDLNSLKPSNSTAKIELFGKYHTDPKLIIRDPYYDSDEKGFEVCYQQCVICSKNFIEHLKKET